MSPKVLSEIVLFKTGEYFELHLDFVFEIIVPFEFLQFLQYQENKCNFRSLFIQIRTLLEKRNAIIAI